MRFGVFCFITDETIGPAELARAAEERGFESLWVPEHTHIPASRRSPYPAGGELPREYARTLDPFLALTAAAAATTTLRLATGICLVVERDPIVLAKEVATLDLLSGGRFLFGVGGGWNREEMEHHGTDPKVRFDVLRERVLAMKALWTEDEAEYHGEHVDLSASWSWPKPVQCPHPPVVVGGNGARALDRVLDYGDEWMPIAGRDPGVLRRIPELRERGEAAGRGRIPVSLYAASSRPEAIEEYVAAGVDRCVFWLPPASASEIMPRLDAYAQVVEGFAHA